MDKYYWFLNPGVPLMSSPQSNYWQLIQYLKTDRVLNSGGYPLKQSFRSLGRFIQHYGTSREYIYNVSKSRCQMILSNTVYRPVQKKRNFTNWLGRGTEDFLHFQIPGVTEREKTYFQTNKSWFFDKRIKNNVQNELLYKWNSFGTRKNFLCPFWHILCLFYWTNFRPVDVELNNGINPIN